MAITYLGSRRIQGLSTDTKPTNVPNNTEFTETDTGDVYKVSSGTWSLLNAAGGGSGGAPTNAEYVTMSLNGTLTAERRLQVTSPVGLTDGGANGDVTLKINPGSGGQYLKTNAGATAVVWENDTLSVYMDDLQDVDLATPVHRNQSIVYDGSNYFNSNQGSFFEKTGRWVAGPTDTAGIGLLDTVTVTSPVSGTITDINDNTNGHGRRFTSDAASTASFGLSQNVSFYQRQWNTRMLAKVASTSQNSNMRFWIGFTSSTTLPNSSTPLASISGVLFGIITLTSGTPNTNFEVIHNSGDATTTTVSTGIPVTTSAGDTTAINVEIAMNSTDIKVYASRGTTPMALVATLTTDIPATNTVLYPYLVAARSGGSAKVFDIINWMVGTT